MKKKRRRNGQSLFPKASRSLLTDKSKFSRTLSDPANANSKGRTGANDDGGEDGDDGGDSDGDDVRPTKSIKTP